MTVARQYLENAVVDIVNRYVAEHRLSHAYRVARNSKQLPNYQ